MNFSTEKEAKEFLVSEIVSEAYSRGNPLSEIERKMLYFTESGWTPSDMDEISEAFDRDYNQPEYEKKIRRLARSARKQLDVNTAKAWSSAVTKLSNGDHYLLVMLDLAGANRGLQKPRMALYLIAGVVVVFLFVVSLYLSRFPNKEEGFFFLWLVLAVSAVAYLLGRFAFGREAVDRVVERLLDPILIGWRLRSKSKEEDVGNIKRRQR